MCLSSSYLNTLSNLGPSYQLPAKPSMDSSLHRQAFRILTMSQTRIRSVASAVTGALTQSAGDRFTRGRRSASTINYRLSKALANFLEYYSHCLCLSCPPLRRCFKSRALPSPDTSFLHSGRTHFQFRSSTFLLGIQHNFHRIR